MAESSHPEEAPAAREQRARKRADESVGAVSRLSGELSSAQDDLGLAREQVRSREEALAAASDVDGLLALGKDVADDASEDGGVEPLPDRTELEAFKRAAEQALEQAQAVAKKCAQEVERLQKAHAEALKERDEAARELASAEDEALLARRKEAREAEEKLLPEKKLTRFLVWDGTRDLQGQQNRWPAPGDPTPAQERRKKWREDKKQRIALSRSPTEPVPVALPTGISVRIVSCTREGAAVVDRFVIEVQVKRMHLVRSLLLRVQDQAGRLVYQEVLGQGQIDLLPEVRDAAARGDGQPALERVLRNSREPAPDAESPFRFRVWVSRAQDAFRDLAPTVEPEEKPAEQVHDQSLQPFAKGEKRSKVLRSSPGLNQAGLKRTRLVTVCAMRAITGHSDSEKRNGRDDAARASEVLSSIAAANAPEVAGPPRPGELRILLGPEWNFAQVQPPWTYSPARKDDLLRRLKQVSNAAAARGWLVMPGTVLWGVPNAQNGVEAVFNSLPVYCENVEIHQYNKRQFGGDTAYSADGRGPTEPAYFQAGFVKQAEGWERRTSKLDASKMPPSLWPPCSARWYFNKGQLGRVEVVEKGRLWTVYDKSQYSPKRWAIEKTAKKELTVAIKEMFALTLEDPAQWDRWLDASLKGRRAQFVLRPFFQHGGARIAVEICADHRGGRAVLDYQAADGSGAGQHDGVDVHLLTSSDVNPSNWRVVTRSGGLFVYLDGNNAAFRFQRVRRHRAIRDIEPYFRAAWPTRHVGMPTPAINLAPAKTWETDSVTLEDLPIIEVDKTDAHPRLSVARALLE